MLIRSRNLNKPPNLTLHIHLVMCRRVLLTTNLHSENRIKILKEKYMGQHTWFLKSKELYLKQNELYDKLDKFENNEIYLDDLELLQINTEIDEIDEQNDTEYHDLFRTGKRNEDSTYTDDVIFSKKECFEWIDKPENCVSFKNTVFDTDEQEKINREYSINKLNEFWDKYPDGVIYFG